MNYYVLVDRVVNRSLTSVVLFIARHAVAHPRHNQVVLRIGERAARLRSAVTEGARGCVSAEGVRHRRIALRVEHEAKAPIHHVLERVIVYADAVRMDEIEDAFAREDAVRILWRCRRKYVQHPTVELRQLADRSAAATAGMELRCFDSRRYSGPDFGAIGRRLARVEHRAKPSVALVLVVYIGRNAQPRIAH